MTMPTPVPPPPSEPVQEVDQDCAVEHEHSFQRFELPGEPAGRVYQCVVCLAIGFRQPRFRGLGKIVLYQCSKPKCGGTARSRIPGRGPRGAYVWACFEHAVTVTEVSPTPPSSV